MRSRFFWDSILILFLVILVFYFLFLSEIFKIKEIKISAPESISQKEIQAILEKELKTPFLYFFHQDTFFLVHSKKIEEKILKEYLEVKEANLEKKFFGKLFLEIKTREAVAQFCFNSDINPDTCFLIDSTGIIYTGLPRVNLVLIFREQRGEGELGEVRTPGEQVVSPEKMNQLLKIKNQLQDKIKAEPEEFHLREGERMDVKTTEGWEIYFDLAGDINLALTKLSLLFEKEILPESRENLQYIDLRFSKVYYK